MTIRTSYRDVSGFRSIKNIYFNDNDTWRTIKRAWINDNGIWRLIFVPTVVLDINSNTNNYNVTAEALSQLGYTPDTPINIEVNVAPGVIVGSNTTITQVQTDDLYTKHRRQTIQGPAMVINNDIDINECVINNNGYIVGAGGIGAYAGRGGTYAARDGGDAINTFVPLTINNNGTIAGGGGGGSGYYSSQDHVMGGGPGAGSNPAPGQHYAYHGNFFYRAAATLLNGNAGGNDNFSGRGGNLGANGNIGSRGGTRGLAGRYLIRNGNTITWIKQGDVRGRLA